MFLRNVTYAIMIPVVMGPHAVPYPIGTMNVFVLRDIMEKTVTRLLTHVMEILVQTEPHAKFLKQDDLRKFYFKIILKFI